MWYHPHYFLKFSSLFISCKLIFLVSVIQMMMARLLTTEIFLRNEAFLSAYNLSLGQIELMIDFPLIWRNYIIIHIYNPCL